MGTSASVSFWREGLRRDRYSDGDNDHGQGGESDIPSAARPAPQSMPEPMQSQPPPQYGSSRSRSFFANLRRGGASANGDDDLLGSDDAAFEDGSAAIQSMLAASAGPESLPHEAQSQQDTAMENFLDDYSLSIQDENSDSGDDSFVEFSAAASQHVLQQQGSSSKPLSVPSLISSVRLLPIRIYARSGSASDRRGVTPTRSGRQHGRMVGQTNNVVHSLLAREMTGSIRWATCLPSSERLKSLGGSTLYNRLDKPSAGIPSEVSNLKDALDASNWDATCTIVGRLAPRLIGDYLGGGPAVAGTYPVDGSLSTTEAARSTRMSSWNDGDPALATAIRWRGGGGGRTGFERDAFVLSDGIPVLIRVFFESPLAKKRNALKFSFSREDANVAAMRQSRDSRSVKRKGSCVFQDARHLSQARVAASLANCWNEALTILREMLFHMPQILVQVLLLPNQIRALSNVTNSTKTDDRHICGEFLPWLFTLLAQDDCFDACATLIEEILSIQSQACAISSVGGNDFHGSSLDLFAINGQQLPPVAFSTISTISSFYLGDVDYLYDLWGDFNCRQLAHFCRILALLVFEPEDRHLMESPTMLKSVDLLQLRRDRAARAGGLFSHPSSGCVSHVELNQAIVLGDASLIKKLMELLQIMNYAPDLHRRSAYHVIAHVPWIADTLIMLGLDEVEDWDDVLRLDSLARKIAPPVGQRDAWQSNASPSDVGRRDTDYTGSRNRNVLKRNRLGSVADMLENLSETLLSAPPSNDSAHLGHIVHVINAAQTAGVVVGRHSVSTSPRSPRSRSGQESLDISPAESPGAHFVRSALSLSNHFLFLRSSSNTDLTEDFNNRSDERTVLPEPLLDMADPDEVDASLRYSLDLPQTHMRTSRYRITRPQDAANELQFNAFLLAPYQVEVFFVFCTLLGGRRKIDVQAILTKLGLIDVLTEMFDRLSWGTALGNHGTSLEQQDGVHGPGCECNPESALRVQYLRLVHNFCDRDSDNYQGRKLMLSEAELSFIRQPDSSQSNRPGNDEAGLISKLVMTYIREQDDSPYKFWLASCVEAFLRGASLREQMFVAKSGLLRHLLHDILSDRLHCAGSLQTSFDLLGEICKGNVDALVILMREMDEIRFRRLWTVAASNLVDSNVFIRAMLLGTERTKLPLNLSYEMSFLMHSWVDIPSLSFLNDNARIASDDAYDGYSNSEWFLPAEYLPTTGHLSEIKKDGGAHATKRAAASGRKDLLNLGDAGWRFSPPFQNYETEYASRCGGEVSAARDAAARRPNSLARLSWFLASNQSRILRDLLRVVDLSNINHENICCLNTAILIAIFAHRRSQLAGVVDDLRCMNAVSCMESSLRSLDLQVDGFTNPAHADLSGMSGLTRQRMNDPRASLKDQPDILRNFRELLWFWSEYYTHRGKDRLSLEFSSRIRYGEWMSIVAMLCADKESKTALVRRPILLPTSPYSRAPRFAEGRWRGV